MIFALQRFLGTKVADKCLLPEGGLHWLQGSFKIIADHCRPENNYFVI